MLTANLYLIMVLWHWWRLVLLRLNFINANLTASCRLVVQWSLVKLKLCGTWERNIKMADRLNFLMKRGIYII
jgi:hypothetical protein